MEIWVFAQMAKAAARVQRGGMPLGVERWLLSWRIQNVESVRQGELLAIRVR